MGVGRVTASEYAGGLSDTAESVDSCTTPGCSKVVAVVGFEELCWTGTGERETVDCSWVEQLASAISADICV